MSTTQRSPEQDARFAEVTRELTAATPAGGGESGLLFMTLALFVATARLDSAFTDVAVLVLVLALHEGGHWAAMKAFGYVDLKVFFVPFLGAATTGRSDGVAAWKRAIVSLAGPVPGAALGLVLLLTRAPGTDAFVTALAKMLLYVNAFNLLPLMPLDGGRVLNDAFFSRSPIAERVTSLLGTAGLVALSVRLGSWGLGVFAAFGFLMGTAQVRFARAAREVRARWETPPATLETAPVSYLRDLFDSLHAGTPPVKRTAKAALSSMRAIHLRVRADLATVVQGGAIVAMYGLSFVLVFGGALAALVIRAGGLPAEKTAPGEPSAAVAPAEPPAEAPYGDDTYTMRVGVAELQGSVLVGALAFAPGWDDLRRIARLKDRDLDWLAVVARSPDLKGGLTLARHHVNEDEMTQVYALEGQSTDAGVAGVEAWRVNGRTDVIMFRAGPHTVGFTTPTELARGDLLEAARRLGRAGEPRTVQITFAPRAGAFQAQSHRLVRRDDGSVQVSSEYQLRSVFDAEDVRQQLAADTRKTVRREGKTLRVSSPGPTSMPELQQLFVDLGIATKLHGR
jgi:Zn-dependent protease